MFVSLSDLHVHNYLTYPSFPSRRVERLRPGGLSSTANEVGERAGHSSVISCLLCRSSVSGGRRRGHTSGSPRRGDRYLDDFGPREMLVVLDRARTESWISSALFTSCW